MKAHVHTEVDGCYFVVVGQRRGAKKHSKKLAWKVFRKKGLIAQVRL